MKSLFAKYRSYLLSFSAFVGLMAMLAVGAKSASWVIVNWKGSATRWNTTEFEILSSSEGGAADFVPGTDNTNALGTSAKRFSDVESYDMALADDLTVADDATIADIFGTTAVISTTTIKGTQGLRFQAGAVLAASTLYLVTPAATGIIILDSSNIVWVSTATTQGGWQKIGAQ